MSLCTQTSAAVQERIRCPWRHLRKLLVNFVGDDLYKVVAHSIECHDMVEDLRRIALYYLSEGLPAESDEYYSSREWLDSDNQWEWIEGEWKLVNDYWRCSQGRDKSLCKKSHHTTESLPESAVEVEDMTPLQVMETLLTSGVMTLAALNGFAIHFLHDIWGDERMSDALIWSYERMGRSQELLRYLDRSFDCSCGGRLFWHATTWCDEHNTLHDHVAMCCDRCNPPQETPLGKNMIRVEP